MVSALALKMEFKTSKHSQLLSWFNREIVKTGLIDKNFGKFYLDAFEMRQEGDYDDLVEFDKNYIVVKFNQVKDFIEKVKEIIAG